MFNKGGYFSIIRNGSRLDEYNDTKRAIDSIKERPLVTNGVLDLNRQHPDSTIIYSEIEQAIQDNEIDINKAPNYLPSNYNPLEAACWLGRINLVELFIDKYGKGLKVTYRAKSLAEEYPSIHDLLCKHEKLLSEPEGRVMIAGEDTVLDMN